MFRIIKRNANKYTFVWKKSVTKFQTRLFEKIAAFGAECETLYGIHTVYYDQISVHTLKRLLGEGIRQKAYESSYE